MRRVKEFASYLKRSPNTAKPEDVRGFQLHLISSGAGTPKVNATVAALRFFFRVTLDRPDLDRYLSTIHEPRKAPVILSPDEMARFLEAAPGIKYKAALSVGYGAGLRVSEIAFLKYARNGGCMRLMQRDIWTPQRPLNEYRDDCRCPPL